MATKKEVILQRLLARLQSDTRIVDVDPGSIVRTFCEILSEEYNTFYDELNLNTTMGFVSTATGQFLDLIGALLNCTRLTGETDSNYRARIVNQVFVLAGGNLTSIRLKVLSIAGVKDVITREFTRGTGSFSLYVITDEATAPQSLINQVEDVVNQAKSFGIMAEVKTPVLIPVQLKVRLVFSDKVTDTEKASIRQTAKQGMKSYIDNIGLGGTFSMNDVLRAGYDASKKVVDSEAITIKVNGVTQFAKNFTVDWDQRIVIDSLDVI